MRLGLVSYGFMAGMYRIVSSSTLKDACKQYAVTLVAIDGINKAGNRSSIGTVITRVEPTSQSLNYTHYTVLSG